MMQEKENADFASLGENKMMQEKRKTKLCMTSAGQNDARNNKNQNMHDTPRKTNTKNDQITSH